MPAHAAALVQVNVVSLGIAGTGAYTYNPGPALLFPAPPGGEVGVAYSDQLTVTGGTSPFTWSVSAGSLPPGVTLGASTGLLSGTPTTAGSYSFTVKVTDNSGLSDTEAGEPDHHRRAVAELPRPAARLDQHRLQRHADRVRRHQPVHLVGERRQPARRASASAPAGPSAAPRPRPAPTASRSRSPTPTARRATQATSITINAGVSTTFAAPPAGQVGVAYTDTLTATGGTAPYTWSVNAGSLPPGITLSSAGVLAGTPTTAGSYPFTVNVIDQNNGIATTSITLVVAAALTLTSPPRRPGRSASPTPTRSPPPAAPPPTPGRSAPEACPPGSP